MKKITDERLIMRNLKNNRAAFAIENLVILIILVYETIRTGSYNEVWNLRNPVFLILQTGVWLLVILSLSISGPMEEDKTKFSKKKLTVIAAAVWLAAFLFFYFAMLKSHVLLAIGCGALISAVCTGILVYGNSFRE